MDLRSRRTREDRCSLYMKKCFNPREEKSKIQIPIPIWQRRGVETGENTEEEKKSTLYEAKEKIQIHKGTGIEKNTGENTNTNSNRA